MDKMLACCGLDCLKCEAYLATQTNNVKHKVFFELLVKKNKSNSQLPKFKKSAKENICKDKQGLTVYYSNQCPFIDYYVNTELKVIAKAYDLPLKIIHIDTKEKAYTIPSAFGIHNVFYKGKFLTHELLTKKRFDKMWKDIKNL